MRFFTAAGSSHRQPTTRSAVVGCFPLARLGAGRDDGEVNDALFWALHGFHRADGKHEWLLPIILVAGILPALLGRWIVRLARRGPSHWDEPV